MVVIPEVESALAAMIKDGSLVDDPHHNNVNRLRPILMARFKEKNPKRVASLAREQHTSYIKGNTPAARQSEDWSPFDY